MTSVTRVFAVVVGILLIRPSIGYGQTTAIVGATVIDGTGSDPLRNATVLVQGNRITAVGPRASVSVPSGARVIDAANKFVTPGFIDVNVHITGQGFMKELFPALLFGEKDPFARYGYALEAAQMALKFGVTTIRDTFGPLPTLLALRDAIARGELVGPRLQVAGDILGWSGGMYCADATPIDRQWCDYFRGHLPVGAELTLLYPDSVRKVINRYLDLGVDFIKFGETTEGPCCPAYIVFSPRVQRAIVEEAHKRGIKVDVHSSNAEGHLLAAEAGVDLITHTGLLSQEISDEVVQALRDRKVVCGLFTSWSTGPMSKWLEATNAPPAATDTAMAAAVRRQVWPNRQRRTLAPLSGLFGGQAGGFVNVKTWRYNDAKLIKGKCTIAVGTDAAPTPLPEVVGPNAPPFVNPDRPFYPDPGIGTILAIEGLVELGMTPSEAIVAGTAHGALATGKSAELGTIAVGKLADLLILRADPLADISNIRKVELIIKDGRPIDPDSLPTRPVYYRR